MTKTKLLLLCAIFTSACAAGDGDDDGNAETTGTASVAETTSTDTMTTTSATTSATTTMTTTSATTAETLTTSESADSSEESGSSSGGAPVELSCENYCSIYLAACADFSEYANEEDCISNCEQWPAGEETDTVVDTLGCRIYHATVAGGTDPSMHCPHAGPSGAETCIEPDAPDCETYCGRFAENCVDGLYTYENNDDCLMQCSTWYPGTAKDVDGHTIGCHTYHAGAAQAGPDEHCPHAGAGGGGICVL